MSIWAVKMRLETLKMRRGILQMRLWALQMRHAGRNCGCKDEALDPKN